MRGERGHVYRELGREVLQILNEPGDLREALERVIAAVKARTGFDAVGVRLRDGEDYPYAAQSGLPADLLSTENSLLERGPDGAVCRGANGRPRLACTCGMVLSAEAASANPLLTPGGSFWTNDSAPLLKLPRAKDPRFMPRNRCITSGFASVALVPIRAKDEIVGLIHINDRRKRRFTGETIELLEGVGASIGAALMRKRLEADLRDSEEKYRAVFDSGFDPVFLIDARTLRFESVNAAALKQYGYTEGELLALGSGDLSADPAMSRAKLAALAEGSFSGRVTDISHRRKDGSVFPVEISPSRCVIGGEVKIVASVHDLTRRRREAAATAKAAAEAARHEEREKLSMEMMATVSHELRTPLAAIQGYAETLRRGGLEDKKNRLDFVRTIEKHAKRLSYLVEDLLLLSDLDSRSKPPEFVDLDLAAFVEDCVTGLAPLIDKGGSKLSVAVPPGLRVRADADRLARVFQNLLDNAYKYNRPEGSVRISARAEGASAVVTVGDTGRGIPERDLPFIFGPFFRSRDTRHIHGTGLGLSIVKGIVERHGGRVWVESVMDEGSEFRFTLPLAG